MTLPWPMIGQLLLSALLGGLIGIERDLSGRAAGLRTNLIIAVSSCLFTIISVHGFGGTSGAEYDPARIAAQIVTGVGFLGAGALIHNHDRVLGLTTAADIWLVAAIGMAIGADMIELGIFVTILILICLPALAPLSHWLENKGNKRMKRKGLKVVKE